VGKAAASYDLEALRGELAARDAALASRDADLAARDAQISSLAKSLAGLEGKVAALEASLVDYADENELLKRKLFGPRSERTGTSELQLPLAGILTPDELALKKQLEALDGAGSGDPTSPLPEPKEPKERPKPKGRRDLSKSKLPKILIEIGDEELEATAKRIGYEDSCQLMRRPGGFAVLVIRRAKYEVQTPLGPSVVGTASFKTAFPRSLLHSSVYAWLAVQKFALGVPHYRLEQHLASQGEPIDRGTMSRCMEDLGNLLGATIVSAAMAHAKSECAIISTDATGGAIHPGPRKGGPKRPCKKGHFFTFVADTDHVLFEYVESHDSATVAKLFEGFCGYVQSDASSVYDILERGPPGDEGSPITLVGCWAHARRYFFEAAVCKYPVGVEGLRRIREIYRQEKKLAGLSPHERKLERVKLLGPLIDDFYVWVGRMRGLATDRNLASKALGYAHNQEAELRRVLNDGRLAVDNTRSERALRKIVLGRKNWMFYGSEVHAQAAAAIFSIIASCRLHRLDPQRYLEEVLLVLPWWPREQYLDLAPFRWAETRKQFDDADFLTPYGPSPLPDDE
jgi:transposase